MLSLGTVRINSVDGLNGPASKTAIEELKEASRGSWRFCQANYKEVGVARGRKRTNDQVPQFQQTASVVENAGYVVWKDGDIVVFYFNDLERTPTAPVMAPSQHSIQFIHGLSKISR